MRRGSRLLAVSSLALVLHTGRADAEVPLDEARSTNHYVVRSAAVAAVLGLTFTIPAIFEVAPSTGPASEWFPGDESVRRNSSAAAAQASDVALVSTIATPLVAQLAGGVDTTFANTTLLYVESLSANGFFNTLVKYTVQRPRPYTHQRDVAAGPYIESQGKDAFLSFYSGHSSTAFAAAVAGSYLFAAGHPDSSARRWMWGAEFALAGATATWRVRAGKHYYSDVLVGALVGSAIGIGVPLLEGIRYRIETSEYAFLGGGLLAGVVVAELIPFRSSVDAPIAFVERVAIAPKVGPHEAGLLFSGRF
jgi:membrane-associated phospholipid phosphatase